MTESERKYVESVLRQQDGRGMLSPGFARSVLADHQILESAWLAERPMGAGRYEARPILHWLGYR